MTMTWPQCVIRPRTILMIVYIQKFIEGFLTTHDYTDTRLTNVTSLGMLVGGSYIGVETGPHHLRVLTS